MFDFITNPLGDLVHFIGNVFQFIAVVIVVFLVAIVAVIPFAMKWFAINLAKTVVVETAKLVEVASANSQIKNAVNTIATQLTNTSNALKENKKL
ncbi:MAG: hypothetical protein EBU08_16090 [Micrococcales bacterium]|nr:hypothetical protein [Micrococcales bacterium]